MNEVFSEEGKNTFGIIESVKKATSKKKASPGRDAFVKEQAVSLLLALVAYHGKVHHDHVVLVVERANQLADELGY